MKIVSNYLGANFDNLLKTSSWLPLRLNKLHQDILVSINVVRAITDNLAVNDTNLKNQLDSLIVQLNSRISKINEDARVLYVGMTRAKKRLAITASSLDANGNHQDISRFLSPIKKPMRCIG